MIQLIVLLLVMFAITCCAPVHPLHTGPLRTEATGAVPPDAIDGGIRFLLAQRSPAVNLLRESPITAPDRHWLMTDNWLAGRALAASGFDAEAASVLTAVNRLLPAWAHHGLIECLTGMVVAWPPRAPVTTEVAPTIWLEVRAGAAMVDWREYADLTLYAAINAANQGNMVQGRDLYRQALTMFDGTGFRDKAFDGRYTTYKLALARIAAARLGLAPEPGLLHQLLAMQGDDGGFIAHYTADEPVGDANTETTAYALLALLD